MNSDRPSRALTYWELHDRCREGNKYLVAGMVSRQEVGLLAGPSGVGKTAFAVQMGMSVASGQPFLERPTSLGRVLLIDLENSAAQIRDLIARQTAFLKLDEPPETLYVADPGELEPDIKALVSEVRPDLCIVDSLGALEAFAEDTNSFARKTVQDLKTLARRFDTSFLLIHHTRKPARG